MARRFEGERMARALCLLLVLLSALCSCRPTATPAYQDIKFDTSEYVKLAALGPGDIFEVRVHGHSDLTGTHRVSTTGEIDYPLVGRIRVGGLTSNQIADRVRIRLLDGFLRQPHVTVYVKQFNSKKVFVLGQVKKPGMFAYQESMNVVQAIALAGGFTGLAEENYVTVTREEGERKQHIRIPVRNIVADQGSQNFLLRPGDIVFVPEAMM